MGVVITGYAGQASDFTIQETGVRGLTFHVLDMGQDITCSTTDPAIIAAVRAIQPNQAVRVPVRVSLSTYGGSAKIKYRMEDKPQAVAAQGAR